MATAFIIYLQVYLLRWKPPAVVVPPNMNRRKSLAITATAGGGLVITEEDLPLNNTVPSLSAGVDSGRRDSLSSSFYSVEEEEKTQWVDLSTVGSIFDHAGSSFYLRLGVVSELYIVNVVACKGIMLQTVKCCFQESHYNFRQRPGRDV